MQSVTTSGTSRNIWQLFVCSMINGERSAYKYSVDYLPTNEIHSTLNTRPIDSYFKILRFQGFFLIFYFYFCTKLEQTKGHIVKLSCRQKT